MNALLQTRVVTNDPRVTYLRPDDNLKDWQLEVISSNTVIRVLDVRFIDIYSVGAQMIGGMQNLKELYIGFAKIGTKGAIFLSKMPNLKVLDVRSNGLTKDGALALASNASIERLVISENPIGSEGAFAFTRNTTLRGLDMEACNIGSAGAKDIAWNRGLRHLNVSRNGIGPDGVIELAQHATVTHLDVSFSELSAEAIYILSTNPRLRSLNLAHTNLHKHDFRALFENKNIGHLDLTFNLIEDEEMDRVESTTFKSSGIKSLKCNSNQFGVRTFAKIASMPRLEHLTVDSSGAFTGAELEPLLYSQSIKHLWIYGRLEDEDGLVNMIISSFSHNRRLESAHLDRASDSSMERLRKAFREKSNLKQNVYLHSTSYRVNPALLAANFDSLLSALDDI